MSNIAGLQKVTAGLALALTLGQHEVDAQITSAACGSEDRRQLTPYYYEGPNAGAVAAAAPSGGAFDTSLCASCGTTTNITHYFVGADSWGDGWNGNAMTFNLDYANAGVCLEGGNFMGVNEVTLTAVATLSIGICAPPGGLVVTECGGQMFEWTLVGVYQSEISYQVTAVGETDSVCLEGGVAAGTLSATNIFDSHCSINGTTPALCCTNANGKTFTVDKTLVLGSTTNMGWYNYDAVNNVVLDNHVLTLPDSMCTNSKDSDFTGSSVSTDGQDGLCTRSQGSGGSGAQCSSFSMEFISGVTATTLEFPVGGNSYFLGSGSGLGTSDYTYMLLDSDLDIMARTSADCGKFLNCVDTLDTGCPLCPCTSPTHTVHMYDSVGDGWDPLVVALSSEYGYPSSDHPASAALSGWFSFFGTADSPYTTLAHYVTSLPHPTYIQNYQAHIPMQLVFEPFVESCAEYGSGAPDPFVPIEFEAVYSETMYYSAGVVSTRGQPTANGYHKALDMCFNETALNEFGYGFTIGLAIGGVNRSQNTFELVNNASGIVLCAGNGLCGQCRLGQTNMTACEDQENAAYCMLNGPPFYATPGEYKLTVQSTDSDASRYAGVTIRRDVACYAGMEGSQLTMSIESDASLTALANGITDPVTKTQVLGISSRALTNSTTSITTIKYPMKAGDDTLTFHITNELTGETICVGRGDCGECIPGNLNASYCSMPTCEYCEENDNGDMDCETVRANQEITAGSLTGAIQQSSWNQLHTGWCTGDDEDEANEGYCDPTKQHPNLEIHHGCYVNATGQSDNKVTARYPPDTLGFTHGIIEYNNTNIKQCLKGNFNPAGTALTSDTTQDDNRCGLMTFHAYLDPFKTHCNKGSKPTNMMSSTGGFEEDDNEFWRNALDMQWGIKDAFGEHLCYHQGRYAYDHEGWSGQDDWACETTTDTWRSCACYYSDDFNDGNDMEENPIGNSFRYCPSGTDEDDEDTWGDCFDTVPQCTFGTDPTNYIGYCKDSTTDGETCSQFTTTTTTPAYVPTTAAPVTTVNPDDQLDEVETTVRAGEDDDDGTTLDPDLAELLGDSANDTDADESSSDGAAAESSSCRFYSSIFGFATVSLVCLASW